METHHLGPGSRENHRNLNTSMAYCIWDLKVLSISVGMLLKLKLSAPLFPEATELNRKLLQLRRGRSSGKQQMTHTVSKELDRTSAEIPADFRAVKTDTAWAHSTTKCFKSKKNQAASP